MSEKEPYKWVTIRGQRIPIYKDEQGNDVFGVGSETKAPADLNDLSSKQTKEWFKENSNYDEWDELMDEVDYTKDKSEWWKFDAYEAIHNYTGERYKWINEYLAKGETNLPSWYSKKDIESDTRQIDYAISNFELKKPLTVYRSADTSMLGNSKMSYEQIKALEGKTIPDKAYTSASTVRELPGEQTVGGDVSYVISVPSGKGVGAYIPHYSENPQEREFLIKRNSNYVVSKVTKDSQGNTVVYLNMK